MKKAGYSTAVELPIKANRKPSWMHRAKFNGKPKLFVKQNSTFIFLTKNIFQLTTDAQCSSLTYRSVASMSMQKSIPSRSVTHQVCITPLPCESKCRTWHNFVRMCFFGCYFRHGSAIPWLQWGRDWYKWSSLAGPKAPWSGCWCEFVGLQH